MAAITDQSIRVIIVNIDTLAITTGLPGHVGDNLVAGFIMQSALLRRRAFRRGVLQFAVIVVESSGIAQELQLLIGAIARMCMENPLRGIAGFIQLVPPATGSAPPGGRGVLLFLASGTSG